MKNFEKMKLFYEDIFGASVFFDKENTKDCIKIFVDDFRGCDILKMIDEALKRPINTVPPEELTCVPHDQLGYLKIIREAPSGYTIHGNTGYIPYELSAYVDYFVNSDIEQDPNGKEIKKKLDYYFKMRNVSEE
jgi:hypothetical protein